MKLKKYSLFVPLMLASVITTNGATVTRSGTADVLTATAAWTGAAVPTSGDVATWDAASTLANASTTLGSALTWGGLDVQNAAGDVSMAFTGAFTSNFGGINLGSKNLSITTNASANSLTFSSLTGTGALTLGNGASTLNLAQLTAANSLNFNGTLRLRGGTATTVPGTAQANYMYLGNTSTITQAAGTAFALDTGASATNAKDLILDNSVWGSKTLNLTSLSGYGSIRRDSGTGTATVAVNVNQSANTTFNGLILSHGTSSASRRILLQKAGSGQLTLAGLVGLQTASAGGTLANHTVSIEVGGGTLVMTANNTMTGNISVQNGGTLKMQNSSAGSNFTGGNSSMTGTYTVDAGGKLQGFRNGTAAFGTGSIVLNGGTLAQESGNWTWSNNITLNTATTSTLENLSTGAPRSLKIQGIVSGSGNLGFSDPPSATTADTGFIFTGANTMEGAVTIGTGLKVRVGGVPGSDSSLNAGTGGTLGTASVVNDGTLTFSRSDAWSVANVISGGGLVRVGSTGITGSGTQSLTLTSANTYTGGTTVNTGTLILGHATDTLADTGPLTITGGTCDIEANSDTVGAVSLTGGTITGSTGVLSASSCDVSSGTVSAILGGTGGLTKNTTGSVLLTKSNTYTGPTLVLQGSLVVNGSINAGSAVTLADGGILTGTGSVGGAVTVETGSASVTAGDGTNGSITLGGLAFDGTGVINIGTLANYTASPAVNVTGSLTLSGGAGAVTINLPTGIISAGTYHLVSHTNTLADTSGFVLGTAPALSSRQTGSLVNNAGSLDYVVAGVNPSWTGLLSGEWSTATLAAPKNWTLPGGGSTDYLGGDVVLFDDTATGTKNVTLPSDVSPTAVTFNNSSANYTLAGPGGITGAGGLLKSGTGTLAISSPNTYTGGTTLNAGTLAVTDDTSLGDETGNLTYSGNGTLRLSAGFDTYRNQIINSGVTATIDTNGFNIVQNGGAISGGGTLVKSGAGVLDLLSNTYTGGTVLNQGTISLWNADSLGATSGSLSFAGNGTLLVNGTFTSSRACSISGVTATFDTNGNTLTQSGVVSGTGSLVKEGSGTLALTSNNTFNGAVSVNAGTLKFTGGGAVASTSATIAPGATLEWGRDAAVAAVLSGGGTILRSTTTGNATFSGANSSFTGGWNITSGYVGLTNDGVVGESAVNMTWNGGGIFFTASGNTLAATRTITLGAGGGYLNGSTGNTNTFAAKFTGSGNLNKVSGERAILTNPDNDFTGNIAITGGGTLEIGGAGRFGGGSYAGTIANANTLAVNTTANQTLSGVISGAGSLTKNNTGTLALAAANTYTGTTTVNGGTLVIGTGAGLYGTGAFFGTVGATYLVVNSGATLETRNWNYGDGNAFNQLRANSYAIRIDGGAVRFTEDTTAVRGFRVGANGATLEAVSGATYVKSAGTVGGENIVEGVSGGTLTLTGAGNGEIQDGIGTYGTWSATAGVVKSGTGTWSLTGANTYTGDTVVNNGVLAVNGTAIADANKLVINGGKVSPSGTETVDTLYFGAVQQAGGTWGATGSGATHIDDVHFSGTGKINVVTGPLTGYGTWAAANAGGQEADQDYDGDGVSNGIEYFMGQTGSSFTANPGVIGGTVTWPRDPAAVATFKVQVSDTLGSWTDINPPDPSINTTNPNQVVFTLPTGSSKKFCRLVVTP